MPRRHSSNPPTTMPTDSPRPSKSQRHRPQPSVEQPSLGMSPEARYHHNLKVLRRRDPSITSIFDQFTHVCVYHHNGETWEKNGFEGSMFLYERDAYPPYGFYILNRMGMDDYVQRLYPEDITGPHGTYLMLRSYPEFTTRRMTKLSSQYDPANMPDKFSDVYFPHEFDKLSEADKGRAHTVGLWMFPTDAREPMIDVMMRLQSYVKQNVPYPDQFRYGPGRPPPPNPHLRTTSPSPPPEYRLAPHGSPTELDRLFAKLATPSTCSAPTASPSPARPKPRAASRSTTSSSTVTVATLFAAANGGHNHDHDDAPQSPTTGIPLLDSIFASAQPTSPRPSNSTATIHSPTPSASVVVPQILNHEVITSLLGLPPSRSASAASTSRSSDARSHPSSREGDNEYEESPGSNSGSQGQGAVGSDGFSESTTVLDPEAEFDEELQAAGASAGRPLLSLLATRAEARHAHAGAGARVNGTGRVHGDVTPRAPAIPLAGVNGHRPPPARGPVPPPVVDAAASASTVRPTQSQPQVSPAFVASSDVWPSTRALVDDTADGLEDGEIVELDFADTSALSDPDAFREVQQRARRAHHDNDADARSAEGSTRRGKARKKGRRERAAERAAQMQHQRSLEAVRLSIDPDNVRERQASSSSRSASASPEIPQTVLNHSTPGPALSSVSSPFVETETPTTARPSKMQTLLATLSAGSTDGLPPPPVTTTPAGLEPACARASVISAVSTQVQRFPSRMERNEFIRELLTLIHTDKTFVDTLWQDYLTQCN